MACYYSQGNIQPAQLLWPLSTSKFCTGNFRPGLQLASQMRLQKAFTDVAIHRTSRGLTTIQHGWCHISQPQSLWIYQLNPNSLFWLPDVCRNHHINIPKRCSPPRFAAPRPASIQASTWGCRSRQSKPDQKKTWEQLTLFFKPI